MDISIKVDTSSIDEATGKAERLVPLIQEAESLADDLASCEITLKVKVEN